MRCLYAAGQISPFLIQISRGVSEPPCISCPLACGMSKLQIQCHLYLQFLCQSEFLCCPVAVWQTCWGRRRRERFEQIKIKSCSIPLGTAPLGADLSFHAHLSQMEPSWAVWYLFLVPLGYTSLLSSAFLPAPWIWPSYHHASLSMSLLHLAEKRADACGSPLWVSCWQRFLSQLLQCVSTASPVWVTNPRLAVQDANPSLQELCQLDTQTFFFLKLWSGFAVIQKPFSQHSFPAKQRSSYWDQGWSIDESRNCTFTLTSFGNYTFICLYSCKVGIVSKFAWKSHHLQLLPSWTLSAALPPASVPTPVGQSRVKEQQLGVRAASTHSRSCCSIACPLLHSRDPALPFPRPWNWFCLQKSPHSWSH